ncbi:hypothetical protein [Neobacillus niacini]|uniref:hypothetical protein n=1 Tax=Neobacillus niacini TaxID=86668 RepID=UPI0021CB9413|nr:hypothetical protein [Neobacillus niacini]MCM3767560.1 hypothetical protein [Neobacillus niacini]
MSTKELVTCKSCGSNSFTTGQVKNSHAKVYPVDKIISMGSSLIYTFCKDCGDVSSIKVEDTSKF